MTKGDILLVTFPFTDLSGTKLRPAVVLNETTQDVTVAFITSQIDWNEPTDLFLQPSEKNGLKKASLIRTNKIATLSLKLVAGLLGKLSQLEISELDKRLKIIFQLE
jgi:mRNA interferase MazF